MFSFLYPPFGALLRTLYDFVASYGLAIILFTLITNVILIYFNAKARKSTLRQQRLAPRQQEIKDKYPKDREGQMKANQEIQQMMQQEGINPMGGCLWTMLPFPIMIVLLGILRQPLAFVLNLGSDVLSGLGNILIRMDLIEGSHNHARIARHIQGNVDAVQQYISNAAVNGYVNFYTAAGEYNFSVSANALSNAVTEVSGFNYSFLGVDLMVAPQLWSFTMILPILAGLFAYLGTHFSQKWSGAQVPAGNMKMMFMLMPLMSVWFSFVWPAGIGLYFLTGSIYRLGQDYFLTKSAVKALNAEDAKRAELEARRKAAEEAMKEEKRKEREAKYASGEKKRPTNYKLKAKPAKKPPKDE